MLVDLIIPRDERSGSATDAGVPAFMDFMMIDQPRRQVAMRGGLALIDRLAIDRFGKRFVSATDRERRALLDEIAYTSNPDRGLSQAIAFFSSFRDLTASGFWSTKMGVADLQYQGNVFVSEWKGCPDAALKKLGVLPNHEASKDTKTHEDTRHTNRFLRECIVPSGLSWSGHALRILPDRQRQRDRAEDRQR